MTTPKTTQISTSEDGVQLKYFWKFPRGPQCAAQCRNYGLGHSKACRKFILPEPVSLPFRDEH